MNCEDALDRIDAGETDDAALRAHLAVHHTLEVVGPLWLKALTGPG